MIDTKVLGLILCGSLALVAGCGGSSNGDKASSAGSSPEANGSAVTGDPVKVSAIFDKTNYDDNIGGIKAAEGAVNASGGINGRPLKIVVCNTENDPNTAAKCARDAAADASIMASIGQVTGQAKVVVPIMEQAKIPMIALHASTGPDFSSPYAFPTQLGGALEAAAAAPVAAVRLLKAKNIVIPYADTPTGAGIIDFANTFLKPLGTEVKGSVAIPLTATDYTAYANTVASKNPDALPMALTLDQGVRLTKQLRSQGNEVSVFVLATVVDVDKVTSLYGKDATNVYVGSSLRLNSPGYTNFLADRAKYSGGTGVANVMAVKSWMGAKMFQSVMKGKELSRASIFAAMNQVSDYNTDGLTPPITFSGPAPTGLRAGFPRIVNSTFWVYKYVNGKFEELSPDPESIFPATG